MKEQYWKILAITAFLLIWEAVAKSNIFSSLIFPSISGSFIWAFNNIDKLLASTLYTIQFLLIGLFLGCIIGLLIGGLASFSNRMKWIVEAFISVFHPLPSISLLPFTILWFGLGWEPIVFIVTFSSMWAMMVNSMAGFSTIKFIYKDIGTIYGLHGISMFRYILLPSALPNLITGFRISWAHSWRTLISAELLFGAIGSLGGLGWIIYVNRYQLNPEGMIAAIAIIAIIGVFMENIILSFIEKRTIKKWGMKK